MTKKKLDQISFSDITDTSSLLQLNNFVISTNSIEKVKELPLSDPFTFDGVMFFICQKGSGRIRITFKEYIIKESSILTIPKNQILEVLERSDDFLMDMLAFSPNYLDDLPIPPDFDLLRNTLQYPILKVSEKELNSLLRYHRFIVSTVNDTKHKFLDKIIRSLLFAFLLEIANLYSEYNMNMKGRISNRNEELVEQFLSLLRNNYQEGRTANYYADKMYITPKHLSSVLKQSTGRSISVWIEDAIIIGLKLQLKTSNLSIIEIADEFNFPNSSYLSRFFKKNTGMTPLEYRGVEN